MPLPPAAVETIDPLATGRAAIRTAFANQAAYCRDNGAPITAQVCTALGALLDGDRGGAVMARTREWAGPPIADALPLRIAGGLHALHLAAAEPLLSSIYRGDVAVDAVDRIALALETHSEFLMAWLDGPPQTNEAGRSWAYAAAMLWLAGQGCPADFDLFEIGSSAGINLMLDRFRFVLGDTTVGPTDAEMRIAPMWRGEAPPDHPIRIITAEGCDVAPIDLRNPAQVSRLRAYIWPEMTERFARLDAAIVAAGEAPPRIARQRAGEFIADVLSRPVPRMVTRVIAHSVVWQYIPAGERAAIRQAIVSAGAAATADSPLSWVMLEANRETHRHELTVRWWPGGGHPVTLATAHPHGSWVDWHPR